MNIHILQHEVFESPGAIENWIKERGHKPTVTRFFEYDKLPEDIADIDLLLIMGGPQSPSTTKDECPYFDGKAEIAFIKKVIEAKKKYLGFASVRSLSAKLWERLRNIARTGKLESMKSG